MRKHLVIALLFLSFLSLSATTWHVSTTGGDTRSGRTWRSAFGSLERALEAASPGDEIWIASGCYEPRGGAGEGSPAASFRLRPGVSLRGGFFGDEDSPRQRHRMDRDGNGAVELWEFAGETILRLPPESAGTLLDGQEEATLPTLLEGLTLLGGNASGEEDSPHPGKGGGAFLRGRYALKQCAFLGNHALQGGGAFLLDGASVEECLFAENTALDQGGALFLSQGETRVTCSLFTDNGDAVLTRHGGAVASEDTSWGEIAFCTFAGNGARSLGSTLYVQGRQSLSSLVAWESQGHPQGILAGESAVMRGSATCAGGFPGTLAQGGILLSTENAGEGGVQENDNRPGSLHPCFLAPQAGDFRLGSGSCLIGRGMPPEGTLPPQDATGTPLEAPFSVGCYASQDKANVALEAFLEAPLQVGTRRPVRIESDVPLREIRLSVEEPELAAAEGQAVEGRHAGQTYLILQYVPEESAYAAGEMRFPLKVEPRPLRVAAHNQTWIPAYGPMPELTWEITSGSLLEGDSLEGLPAVGAPGKSGQGLALYPILQGTLAISPTEHAQDYLLRFRNGLLTVLNDVEPPEQEETPFTAPDGISLLREITYGDALEGERQLQGNVLLKETGQEVPGHFRWEREGECLPCGLYDLEWSFVPVDEALPAWRGTMAVRVMEKELTLVSYEHMRYYGSPNPTLQYLLSGFVLGEDESVCTALPLLATDATIDSPVGEYPIYLKEGSAPNYRMRLLPASLHVFPAPVNVEVASATKSHGAPDPAFSWSPLEGGEIPQEALPILMSREPGEAAGRYAITATTQNPNYEIRHKEAYLEITGVVPQLSRSSSQPLELFQTLRDFQCQCLMKDPDTGEAVEGNLVLHEKYNAELDTPLTSVPISLQHVFYPSDTTRYVPNPIVMIPAQMVHSPLSVKLDDKTITYGDPIPELTWTALAGETVEGVDFPRKILVRELSSSTPDPLPAGTYNIIARSWPGGTRDHYYSPLMVTEGTLTVEKADLYLIVEDKEYTWGEPVPEPTFFFSTTKDGSSPVEDPALAKEFAGEFHVGEPGPDGCTDIMVDGVLTNPNYRLQVVPGTLKCNPRLLTPQWPDDLSMTFRGKLPKATVTALPEELPEGTTSLSTTCDILFPPREEYPYSYTAWDSDSQEPLPLLIKEMPGRHQVYLASGETGDYRFQWDTSVAGHLDVGCPVTLVLEGAEEMADRPFTRKLYASADDPAPETITVIPGVNCFADLESALKNTFPGGTIWLEAGVEVGKATHRLSLLTETTIRRLHSPLWDEAPTIWCTLSPSKRAASLTLKEVDLKQRLEMCQRVQAVDCTLNSVLMMGSGVVTMEGEENYPLHLEATRCAFVRDEATSENPSGGVEEAAIRIRSDYPNPGISLALEDCTFQWVQEKSGGMNFQFEKPVSSDWESGMNIQVDWPIDLRRCTFLGWEEDSPETLQDHFFPPPEKDGFTYFLLPGEE